MNTIVVDADQERGTISRHIYGHFAEHLGRCIYGGIWVGEESSIPNIRGIRTDVVEALKKIKIPNLRWPGGCFADTYHWMDGIGPRKERPSIVNVHWGGVTEDNSFGTHEFLDLCGQLDCEPYICGNVGSGTVQEMYQWVEYITSDARSPMTELRNSNGRAEPWKVKYWGVGNENWGCGGFMRPEYYADLYRRYACFCRNYGGNELFRVACGPNRDDYHWTETLMKNMTQAGRGGKMEPSSVMQGLALHYYTRPRHADGTMFDATGFGEEEWFAILKDALRMEELITRHTAIMAQYDPGKKVSLIVDELGTWYGVEPGTNPGFLYQQNSLRDALAAAVSFDIFHNHCDRVTMTNIAQTVNVLQAMILTDGASMVRTPTYHLYEMNSVHHDARSLNIDIDCGEYSRGESVIRRLSASASRDESGKVHLSVSNLDPNNTAEIVIEVRGLRKEPPFAVSGTTLTASAIDAHNSFEHENDVHPAPLEGLKREGGRITAKLPPKSATVFAVG